MMYDIVGTRYKEKNQRRVSEYLLTLLKFDFYLHNFNGAIHICCLTAWLIFSINRKKNYYELTTIHF